MISLSEVESELAKLESKRKTAAQNIITLVLSLAVFVSIGLFQASWQGITLLVIVLLIHEMGHFAGMKWFGYRDVQMFFIPFFGAAVSGQETNPSGARQAIVSILGPLPGILLGIVSAILYFATDQPLFAQFARTSLFINAFNLVPFYPLDGGRFLDAVLFSRHPIIEVVFKVLAAVALALIALALRSIALGIFAFFVLGTLRVAYFQARAVRKLRSLFKDAMPEPRARIPSEYLETILPELQAGLGKQQNVPKSMAVSAQTVWRKFCQKPPSFAASAVLLFGYVGSAFFGLASPLVFELAVTLRPRVAIVQRTLDNGQTTNVEVRYVGKSTLSEVQLNEEGLYHGPSTTWHLSSPAKMTEGIWQGGFPEGRWNYYDRDGQLTSAIEYHIGQPKEYMTMQEGNLVAVPEVQWPSRVKKTTQVEPRGVRRKLTSD